MKIIIYLFLFFTIVSGDIQADIYKNAYSHIGETYWAKKKKDKQKEMNMSFLKRENGNVIYLFMK